MDQELQKFKQLITQGFMNSLEDGLAKLKQDILEKQHKILQERKVFEEEKILATSTPTNYNQDGNMKTMTAPSYQIELNAMYIRITKIEDCGSYCVHYPINLKTIKHYCEPFNKRSFNAVVKCANSHGTTFTSYVWNLTDRSTHYKMAIGINYYPEKGLFLVIQRTSSNNDKQSRKIWEVPMGLRVYQDLLEWFKISGLGVEVNRLKLLH